MLTYVVSYADRSMHIRSEPHASVVLSGAGGRVLVACGAEGITLEGMQLSQTGGDTSLRGRESVRAVEVFNGALTMVNCTVWSECGIGVMVTHRGSATLAQVLTLLALLVQKYRF